MIGPATINSRNCGCDMSDSIISLRENWNAQCLWMLTMQAGSHQYLCRNGKAQTQRMQVPGPAKLERTIVSPPSEPKIKTTWHEAQLKKNNTSHWMTNLLSPRQIHV